MGGNGLSEDGKRSTMSYLYVDNLYIQVLQKYGLLYLIIFVTLLTLYSVYFVQTETVPIIANFKCFSGHAMIDDITFNLYYNFS